MDVASGSCARLALAEEARAALHEVTDPSARASVLGLLAVVEELRVLTRSAQAIDSRLEQVNQYLGAISNKP